MNFYEIIYECVLCYSVFLMNVYVLYKHSCTCWAKAHVVYSYYDNLKWKEAEIQNLRRQRNHSEQGHEEKYESEPEIEQPRFRRMKPDEFEGSSDPLVAEEWISSIQTILDFMHLNEREKVLCATYVLKKDARYWWETVKMRRNVQDMTWDEFIVEFNQKYYNRMAMRAQQNKFINIKQGSMSVTEAVRKFDQLARLCPYLVPTEEERTKQGYEMKPNSQVQRTNQYENNNNKRKGNFGGQKNGKGSGSQSKKPNITYPTCKKCGKNHPGECRSGTNVCPSITQSRLEAPETNARIFTFSRNDVEAGTSNVVTGQLFVAKMSAYVLFDSGATHSFISNSFADRLNWVRDRMNQSFHIALPSGEVLLSNYWVRHVPIVFSGRELHADLVLIKMYDYDVILGMDFLGKYNALIECRRRRVIFHPYCWSVRLTKRGGELVI
ncbi:hypothetical protein UlMin_041667 [Ulmus minor]